MDELSSVLEEIDRALPTYQIHGGLAARVYGSTRPLHDIDVFVPDVDHAVSLLRALATPHLYRDGRWNVLLAAYMSHGYTVDLVDARDPLIFDGHRWHHLVVDFGASERRVYVGVEVAVMPKLALIAYKRLLASPVDISDAEAIESKGT